MRNIFDQYSKPENRLTHALMSALDFDRKLLRSLLRWIGGINLPCPANQLQLSTQRTPGSELPDSEEALQKGIPDGWIFSEAHHWCIVIEVKVTAEFAIEQLTRHLKTAARIFENVTAIAILPKRPLSPVPNVKILLWSDIYEWLLKEEATQIWAMHLARYIEVIENQRIQEAQLKDGKLTTFNGVQFSNSRPYTNLEARRQMNLLLDELKENSKYRELVKHSDAIGTIRNSDRKIWTTINLQQPLGTSKFNHFPHLTLTISDKCVEVLMTLPDKLRGPILQKLKQLGTVGFRKKIHLTLQELSEVLKSEPTAVPFIRGLQRRYPSIKADPHRDAIIEVDLRTAIDDKIGPKFQPVWLDAAYQVFADKAQVNYELGFGVRFDHSGSVQIKSKKAVDLIAQTWLGLSTLLNG